MVYLSRVWFYCWLLYLFYFFSLHLFFWSGLTSWHSRGSSEMPGDWDIRILGILDLLWPDHANNKQLVKEAHLELFHGTMNFSTSNSTTSMTPNTCTLKWKITKSHLNLSSTEVKSVYFEFWIGLIGKVGLGPSSSCPVYVKYHWKPCLSLCGGHPSFLCILPLCVPLCVFFSVFLAWEQM